ncbi:hypothetical protein BUALT_Bualt10G0022800 [Buddleja alternifolia]|uniref:Ribosomal protein S15Ab n=1 Tax=Buddleja alternifolia TaxID=168488 RepID=A0AAV6X673_9LAMI|nr:hypothetical protein BUALT_Bualt10G0022800 [Buddleja alternifolia]
MIKYRNLIRPSSIRSMCALENLGMLMTTDLEFVVELNGRLNKCGVISPQFDVSVKEIEPWTTRLLPSRQFGYIVLTSSAGTMDHEEARRKNVGGKVLGFFY